MQELIDLGWLEEPLDGNHGSIHPKTSDYVSTGVPFIMATDLRSGTVDYKNCAFITETQAAGLRKGFSHPGDVLLTHKATIGRTAIVPDTYKTIILTPQVTYYRVKKNIDNRYLKYYFDTPAFQITLSNWAGSGSTRAYLGITAQKKLPVILPEYAIQKRVASILGILDDKIRNNNEINENLSDPITHMPSGVLADICSYSSDRIPVSELSISTYFSTENMQPNKMGSVDATSLPAITQTTGCHKGDVLVSNIRPYFKKIVYVTDDRCGCSTDVLCFVPKEDQYSAFLFGTLYMDRFFDYMVAGSKGTKMPRGDKQQIMNYPVVVPDKESLDLFNGLIVPMLDQIATNRSESSRLAALRDALLPKLMSGELDVSDLAV